jgi:DNA helicase II / ATP-dependent DNA helicase PcrA
VVERHGPEPEVPACTSRKQELNAIVKSIEAFRNTAHKSLGIICKSHRQAVRLAQTLAKQISKTACWMRTAQPSPTASSS